jgi:hypothetical protein
MSKSTRAQRAPVPVTIKPCRPEYVTWVSETHVPYGVVALARAGIKCVRHLTYVEYTGNRAAMVKMGVLTESQLPGNGFVNVKRFNNSLDQMVRVERRGEGHVSALVYGRGNFREDDRVGDLALEVILYVAGIIESMGEAQEVRRRTERSIAARKARQAARKGAKEEGGADGRA